RSRRAASDRQGEPTPARQPLLTDPGSLRGGRPVRAFARVPPRRTGDRRVHGGVSVAPRGGGLRPSLFRTVARSVPRRDRAAAGARRAGYFFVGSAGFGGAAGFAGGIIASTLMRRSTSLPRTLPPPSSTLFQATP